VIVNKNVISIQKGQRKDLYREWKKKLNELDLWQYQTAEQKTTLQSQARKYALVYCQQ